MAIQYVTIKNTFLEWKDKCNIVFGEVGDLDTLVTPSSDLVSIINTIDNNLSQTASDVGIVSNLATVDKSSVVAAVNEISIQVNNNTSNIDMTEGLDTVSPTVVKAINEVHAELDSAVSDIGSLTYLSTIDKSDLVTAINELYSSISTNETNISSNLSSIGNITSLTTNNRTSLVNAVNELVVEDNALDTRVGDLAYLNTTTKSSLVGSINEIYNYNVFKTGNYASAKIPYGYTSERDASPEDGFFRYNTELVTFEGYSGTKWIPVGPGAEGGNNNKVFFLNDTEVTDDFSIPSGKNAMTAGPVSINSGVTVTVPAGSTWTIT